MITTFKTAAPAATGSGISTKAIVITLLLVGAAWLAWKNKDKIKAMFGKKPVEPKK